MLKHACSVHIVNSSHPVIRDVIWLTKMDQRNREYLRALEQDCRQFAAESGGYDLLSGPNLFAVMAIRLCGLDRTEAANSFRPQNSKYAPVSFARTPSYTGPIAIARTVANDASRAVTDLDVWLALREHDRQQFDLLCDTFGITFSNA